MKLAKEEKIGSPLLMAIIKVILTCYIVMFGAYCAFANTPDSDMHEKVRKMFILNDTIKRLTQNIIDFEKNEMSDKFIQIRQQFPNFDNHFAGYMWSSKVQMELTKVMADVFMYLPEKDLQKLSVEKDLTGIIPDSLGLIVAQIISTGLVKSCR